jgi:hypothetical protein
MNTQSEDAQKNKFMLGLASVNRYFLILMASFCSLLFANNTWAAPDPHNQLEEQYQSWADLCRIDAVHRISKMIETIHERTGKYPFQGQTNVPVEVRISQIPLQGEYRYPPPGFSGIVLEWSDLYRELAKDLGSSISIPLEPQTVPAFGHINFIQFYMDHSNYWVSANLFKPNVTTRRLADHVYKYEVGSLAVAEKRIRRFKDIPSQEILSIQQSLKGQRSCPSGGSSNLRK